jgi:hypothetical protein
MLTIFTILKAAAILLIEIPTFLSLRLPLLYLIINLRTLSN